MADMVTSQLQIEADMRNIQSSLNHQESTATINQESEERSESYAEKVARMHAGSVKQMETAMAGISDTDTHTSIPSKVWDRIIPAVQREDMRQMDILFPGWNEDGSTLNDICSDINDSAKKIDSDIIYDPKYFFYLVTLSAAFANVQPVSPSGGGVFFVGDFSQGAMSRYRKASTPEDNATLLRDYPCLSNPNSDLSLLRNKWLQVIRERGSILYYDPHSILAVTQFAAAHLGIRAVGQ
jgi:hypothetical protein